MRVLPTIAAPEQHHQREQTADEDVRQRHDQEQSPEDGMPKLPDLNRDSDPPIEFLHPTPSPSGSAPPAPLSRASTSSRSSSSFAVMTTRFAPACPHYNRASAPTVQLHPARISHSNPSTESRQNRTPRPAR